MDTKQSLKAMQKLRAMLAGLPVEDRPDGEPAPGTKEYRDKRFEAVLEGIPGTDSCVGLGRGRE